MPSLSLAKCSSTTSLSSQRSKSPPRKYDGVPPELLEAYRCLCVLLEREMNQRGTPISYIPSFDSFLWEAYKAGNTSKNFKGNPAIQQFLHIVLGRIYSGADSMGSYYDCLLIACIGCKYMGEICGDPMCSWRTLRHSLRWFISHAFPTSSPHLIQDTENWYVGSLEPVLVAERPETAMELLQIIKLQLPVLHNKINIVK